MLPKEGETKRWCYSFKQASLDVYKKGTSGTKSNSNQASVVLGQEDCTTTQKNPVASEQENNSPQVPVALGQEKCKATQPYNSPQVAVPSEQDFVESPLRIF